MKYDFSAVEQKWQKKWADEKLFESNPNDKEKLFITVAFPYPSGAMHIGHGRTYTVPDVYARFKRMKLSVRNSLSPKSLRVISKYGFASGYVSRSIYMDILFSSQMHVNVWNSPS